MNQKIVPNSLIKEIKYARKLHLDELKYRIKEQKQAIKEKNIVIKVLEGRNSKVETTKKILQKWQKNHYFWIDLVKQNKKWAKEGGSVSWHNRWIKVYKDLIEIFK